MENFVDRTTAGNERAFRRGKRVPDGDVNLAWVKSPELTPDNNIVILDTSRTTEENRVDAPKKTQLMYANSLGILEDEFGNQVIDDEYPCVADVFTQDEDFLLVEGSEYEDDDTLPFVHISRYLHADFVGITLGTELHTYSSESLQVVDQQGRNYVDDAGEPKYKIKISPAYNSVVDTVIDQSTGIYRVWAFVDSNANESLYLKYNKVELDTSGEIRNQNVDYTEILNPQPYFTYVPEESDVVDPANHRKKIYTTKPINKKNKAVGQSQKDVEGYRVYVPKKAVPDPRLYQLFRWRVTCDFVQDYKVRADKIDEDTLEQVNVGVIVTNQNDSSYAAYALHNLENSNYNKSNVRFVNPFASTTEKQTAAYWEVNLSTINTADLSTYDMLILSPVNTTFDVSPILGKIDHFVNVVGGTLLIDTNNQSILNNFGFTFSNTFYPVNGGTKTTGSSSYPLRGTTISIEDSTHEIIDGLTSLGGWPITDGSSDNFESVSLYSNGVLGEYIQSIESYPSDYDEILTGTTTNGATKPVLVGKTAIADSGSRKGKVYVCTSGLTYSVNAFVDPDTGKLKYANYGRDNVINTADYDSYINSVYSATAAKMLYNMALFSTKGKYINVDLTGDYSSVWTVNSNWASSWVIDGSVLTDYEKGTNDFVFLPKNPVGDTDTVWQRRLGTKNLKQMIDEQLVDSQLTRLDNATRVYRIETTNAAVNTPVTLSDNTIPHAWTESYSPVFNVPIELGAHIVRSELIQGDFDAGTYVHKSYPSRNYDLQTQITHTYESDAFVNQTTTWTATGTATKTTTYKGTTKVSEPVTTTSTRTITRDEEITWADSGYGTYSAMPSSIPWGTAQRPNGITTWQEQNYFTTAWGSGLNSWPYWGMTSRYSTGENARGEVVQFIQAALNQFIFWGIVNVPFLPEDGSFGSRTAAAVRALQVARNAKYVDGIVGAETWGMIGFQIIRIGQLIGANKLKGQAGYKRFFGWPFDRSDMFNISNGDPSKSFVKKSWVRNGPSTIWDMFTVVFPLAYDIHAVTVIPYVEGASNSCMVRSLHTSPNIIDLTNWDSRNSRYTYLPFRPKDGQELTIPISAQSGRQIIVGMGQDQSSGFGAARIFGVRDIRAHVKTKKTITDTKTIPGGTTFTPGKREVENITFIQTGTVTVNANGSKTVTINALDSNVLQPSGSIQSANVDHIHFNNVRFTGITSSNPNVTAEFDITGANAKMVFSTNYEKNSSSTNIQYGQRLPAPNGGFTYYSRTASGFVNSAPESGWVSKEDGVKLLCDSAGKPLGFPALPTGINTAQGETSAFITMISRGTDPSVVYGFYDASSKEFITSGSGGQQVLSYEDYANRGFGNVFIAVVTSYEVEENKDLPDSSDAPLIPRLWAMPVYGICYRSNSRIGIDPLPVGLGPMDLWSIPIRVGSFDKNIFIQDRFSVSSTHWSQSYEGTTLRAFYGVPEAANGAWSSLYGRPNVDIQDEIPDVLSDRVIQVRQAPILMVREPTEQNTWADPLRPIFTVSTRATVNSPWVTLGREEILDYNVSNGTIYLKDSLASEDANLVKVSYTSSRMVYDFKQYAGNKINLNPYILRDESLIGKPIYIYVVPEYVHTESGSLIAESVETATIRWTTDPGVFSVLDSAMYNPLAIRLGVVYISSAADIENLTMLDTRHRGGGASENVSDGELIGKHVIPRNYWDVNYAAGEAYQSGGFVLIRLPAELKSRFNDDDRFIMEVIDRNIPAGVGYKIEDLNGNSWR